MVAASCHQNKEVVNLRTHRGRAPPAALLHTLSWLDFDRGDMPRRRAIRRLNERLRSKVRFSLSPWQRVVLVIATLACFAYSALALLAGYSFFLSAVTGVVFLVVAMSAPEAGVSRFPLVLTGLVQKSWGIRRRIIGVLVLVSLAALAFIFYKRVTYTPDPAPTSAVDCTKFRADPSDLITPHPFGGPSAEPSKPEGNPYDQYFCDQMGSP